MPSGAGASPPAASSACWISRVASPRIRLSSQGRCPFGGKNYHRRPRHTPPPPRRRNPGNGGGWAHWSVLGSTSQHPPPPSTSPVPAAPRSSPSPPTAPWPTPTPSAAAPGAPGPRSAPGSSRPHSAGRHRTVPASPARSVPGTDTDPRPGRDRGAHPPAAEAVDNDPPGAGPPPPCSGGRSGRCDHRRPGRAAAPACPCPSWGATARFATLRAPAGSGSEASGGSVLPGRRDTRPDRFQEGFQALCLLPLLGREVPRVLRRRGFG
ncbi:hypothetical protein EHYA_06298 [Embleya hyalina]|uniref:Uncharacterized protein n=1 Tax=Embleya hyalina TaxID=516124 RepID=A0A401YVF9_9ACTN|nr:hypothetical protein EHYA_06298 [Embleya hyalina]